MQKNIDPDAAWKIARYLIKAIFISKRNHHKIGKLSLVGIWGYEVACIDNKGAASNLLYCLHFLSADNIKSVGPIEPDNFIHYIIPTTHKLRIQSTVCLTLDFACPILL